MLSQVHYLVRSKMDGRYLAAYPKGQSEPEQEGKKASGYLLLFREQFEALSYLNTHGAQVADRFSVESIPGTQLGSLLERWGFTGIGLVTDPLLPEVQFLERSRGLP